MIRRSLAVLFILATALGLTGCGKNTDSTLFYSPETQAYRLYREGARYVGKGDWTEAKRYFNRIDTEYPSSPYAPLAKLALADCDFYRGGRTALADAIASYQEFLSVYPRHSRAPYAAYRIAQCHLRDMSTVDRDQATTHDALRALQAVVRNYPDSPYSERAQKKIAFCYHQLAAHELAVARYYLRSGSYESAVLRLHGVLADYANYVSSEEVYYLLGEALSKAGDSKEAARSYEKVVKEWPTGAYAREARKRLKKMENRKE